MNGVNKNEVDLLLRSLARGGKNPLPGGSSTAMDGALSMDHLDADELNSYAEGVVPGPARLRYTEHLADCALCRGLVIDLTQAAGAANRYDGAEQKTKSSFWQKLATFLSPAVLRFALPALVLTLVIGVGLFALRQQRNTDYVAQNRAENLPPAAKDSGAALNPTNEPTAKIPAESQPRPSAGAPEDKSNVQNKKLPADQPPVETDSTLAKALSKDAKEAEEAGASARAGEFAVQPPSAQPKAAAPPPAEVAKSADVEMNRAEKRQDYDRQRDEVSNNEADIHGPNRGRNNAPMSTTQRSIGGLASERGPSAMNKNKGADLETRTVLGKRFTRPGAVWIDTDYESQATIKLSRSSEQFRALVADEPGIRTIADRLDGAIIVVWKGRAYRIQ